MKKFEIILIILFFLAFFFIFMSCSGSEEDKRMIDLLNTRCTNCHDLESTRNKSWSEHKWRAVIDDMISMGAHLDDDEKEALIKYLSKEYGL